MTLLFVLSVAILGFVMKLVALFRMRTGESNWKFILSPVAAPNSLRRTNPVNTPRELFGRAALFSGLVVVWQLLCVTLIEKMELRGPGLSFLAVPSIYLLGEALGPWVALLGLPFGRRFPFVLDAPLRSRDLADFWGRRWNVWFSDWFRQVFFRPLKRRPPAATLLIFAVSGVMHEWVINLPLWLVTGRSLFGSQMLYFLIQGVGLLADRRIHWPNRGLRRGFAWLVVIGPVPLVFNEGMLRFLHFWPV